MEWKNILTVSLQSWKLPVVLVGEAKNLELIQGLME